MHTAQRDGFARKTHTGIGKVFMWENGRPVTNREIYRQIKEAFERFQAKRSTAPATSDKHKGWTYSPRTHENNTH